MTPIWTINLNTGRPDKHLCHEVRGCRAKYHEGGFSWTLWGGFFKTYEAAAEHQDMVNKEHLEMHRAAFEKFQSFPVLSKKAA